MRLHTGGCTDTVSESAQEALEVDLDKNLLQYRKLNQYLRLAFQSHALPTELSRSELKWDLCSTPFHDNHKRHQ